MDDEQSLADIVRQQPDVRELRVEHVDISDLTPLAALVNLEMLDLSNCGGEPKDISPLAGLTKLKELNLWGHNGIVDITALERLRNLERLDLSYTGVVDLAPLQALLKLKQLDIGDVSATDLAPLRNLPLVELRLDGCQAADYSPLADLASLRKLELEGSVTKEVRKEPSDFSSVGALTRLQELKLSVLARDYSFLKSCTSLRTLSLWGRDLVDLDALANLADLQTLEVRSAPELRDIRVLGELKKLEEIHFHYCQAIADIDALAGCHDLRVFEIMNAAVTNSSALGKLSKLETVRLIHCRKLDRLGSFSEARSLKELTIECGTFSDLSGLIGHPALESLTLADCPNVTDIAFVATLPNLKSLCLNASKNIRRIRPIEPIIVQLDSLDLDSCFFEDSPDFPVGFESNAADDAREFFGMPRREPPPAYEDL